MFLFFFFFFKQKTAYEIGTGDWSSDVCSSDLPNAEDNVAFTVKLSTEADDSVMTVYPSLTHLVTCC